MKRIEVTEQQTVRLSDTGARLNNPQTGWILNYYTDGQLSYYSERLPPTDDLEDIPELSVIYFRVPWSYLEPNEGQYDWSLIDGPAQRFIDAGKQIAFRFLASDTNVEYATPQWVEAAGASGERFHGPDHWSRDGSCWEPDFEDPAYLEKLESFLAAAGARYDANDAVAFVDVGFGCWGEGHTLGSTRRSYPTEARVEHIDLYRTHFPNTLLVANDDFAFEGNALHIPDYEARERGEMDEEIIEYALAHDLTIRDDSVLVQGGDRAYLSAEIAKQFAPDRPVIIECEHYGLSRDSGAWDDDRYVEAIEAYRASYATVHWFPREFLVEKQDLMDRISRRLGYRIRPTEVSWPQEVTRTEPWQVTTIWQNDGVAPCYPGGHPAITIKERDGIVAVGVMDEQDVSSLPTDAGVEIARGERSREPDAREWSMTMTLPATIESGTYDLYLSVGDRIGTPRIELPLEEGDGHRRYALGTVTVTE